MADILMRFPLGKAKALTLSYDDGVEQDIRLIGIMQRYGLKGTFNLNSGLYAKEGTVYPKGQIHRRMTKKQVLDLYTDSGMEVAVHALTHPWLEELPSAMCVQEVWQDRCNLEKDFDRLVQGMAYPYGTYNEKVLEVLKCCGIKYARTVVSTHQFSLPRDFRQWHATCHHRDPRLEELADAFLNAPEHSKPLLFYLWGHSYEFEMNDNWQVIENFAEKMGGNDRIWYATNGEICDYVQKYEQLIFSADGSRIYNPTDTDLYFSFNGKIICVPKGQEIRKE